MSRMVNRDYIATIRLENGKARFVKEEIMQKEALIEDLKAMVENPNRSVLDMQSRMDQEFPAAIRQPINYISPYSYSSSYVGGAPYPCAPSYDKYSQELEEKRAEYTKSAKEMYSGQGYNNSEFNEKVSKRVEEKMAEFIRLSKKRFLEVCVRYCRAYNFETLRSSLMSDSNVRMCSSDNVGWTYLPYEINDDITIKVYTNFGYGYSSYFHLGLTYKGIDILPYSFLVNYYYADRRDIARYTRLYDTDHNSWDIAFGFVESTANKAQKGEAAFFNEFIKYEIDEMMHGLRRISANPAMYFNDMLSRKNKENESHFLTVHNMNDREFEEYSVFPEEMVMVFQAEKITGALSFLGNLSKLEEVYPEARRAADEIKTLAHNLTPQIERNIVKIDESIAKLREEEEALNQEIEKLNKLIEIHSTAIRAIYERNHENNQYYSYYTAMEEYSKNHNEYVVHKDTLEQKEKCLREVQRRIYGRMNFKSSLESCREEIENMA